MTGRHVPRYALKIIGFRHRIPTVRDGVMGLPGGGVGWGRSRWRVEACTAGMITEKKSHWKEASGGGDAVDL